MKQLSWAAGAAMVCLLIGTGMGKADVPTTAPVERAAYVKQLEAICTPGAEATRRVVKGVRANVQRGLLKTAAGQFARASQIFGGTVKRIGVVPRPSADKPTLAKWFIDLNLQESYLKKISGALRSGEKIRAQGYEARFIHYGNVGNNVVLEFEFHSCRFDPTRFG
ncbi:MAG: hypothetical protein WB507_10155 [Solirubrobacterales bacterium]